MAAELFLLRVAAICAVSPPAVRAARGVAAAPPIIAVDLESDPVANGWTASLGRPGHNITGIFLDFPDFSAKCLQILRELLPNLSKVAVLWHPEVGTLQLQAVQKAGDSLRITIEAFEVSRVSEFEAVFSAMAMDNVGGVLMLSSPLFSSNPHRLAELALRHRLPVINQFPDFAEQGGLLGYGPELQDLFRQAEAMTRRVLQQPAGSELPPVERPIRFKLISNLKTARMLGIDLPHVFLARADEVIE